MQQQKHPFNQQFLQNNSNAPINPQQVLAANPGLANLCNAILANSMQMQQPQPAIPIPIPFNNFMVQPSFCNPQMGLGFTPQNNMFVNPQMGFNYSTFPPYAFPSINMNMNPFQMPNPQNPNFFFNTNSIANANAALPFPNSHQLNPNQLSQLDSFKLKDNSVHNGQNNTSSSSWKRLSNKEYKKNPKQESSKSSNQKSRFHLMNNGKRKFGEHKDKGHSHVRATKFSQTIPTEQAKEQKRSLALIYTEQEIKQWREERRKNFPSKANIEKKCSINLSNSEVFDKEAKLRREQLKEILAKQAELGVEVAEIPSEYLSDAEKLVKGKEENRRSNFKKGRFRRKNDKRGRWNKNNRTAKQNMSGDNDSPNNSSFDERKPTLLQKLLSPEVKKDKEHLLQVFRFMVVNSFFESWPEKPLKYPSVVVKEDEVISEKPSSAGKCDSEIGNKTKVENFGHVDDSNGNDEEEEGEIIN